MSMFMFRDNWEKQVWIAAVQGASACGVEGTPQQIAAFADAMVEEYNRRVIGIEDDDAEREPDERF